MIGNFLLLAALQAQAGMTTQAVSPPPVAVRLDPPPPTAIMAVPRESTGMYRLAPEPRGKMPAIAPLEPVRVRVRIFSGRTLLLSDELRVARYNATDILQRHEAPGDNCPADAGPTVQSSLTFQINREASATPDEFFIGLSWSHPVDGCTLAGSRGVSLAQPVTIKPGESTLVTGDGGLTIELSRP
jgi:hypothetical protein